MDQFQRTGYKKFEERNERRNDKRDNDQKQRTNDPRDDARNDRRNDREGDRKCFVCGKKNYFARNCFHANKTSGMTDNQGSSYMRNESLQYLNEGMILGMTDLKQRQEMQYLKESLLRLMK